MVEFSVLALSAQQAIEPFVERAGSPGTSLADYHYRFGYKIVGTGIVVAAIEVPSKVVEDAISSGLTLSCRLTPDGDVVPECSSENGWPNTKTMSPLPLNVLVRATLAPQNLHIEEATIANLTTMLRRLEEAASDVRETLALCTNSAEEHVFSTKR
jgi:hypothetical protein